MEQERLTSEFCGNVLQILELMGTCEHQSSVSSIIWDREKVDSSINFLHRKFKTITFCL